MEICDTMSILMDTGFSNWLNDMMVKKELTQADLARKSGLTRQAISYYLNGKSKYPQIDALKKIAIALEVPIEVILRVIGVLSPNPELNETEEEMLYDLRRLPEHEVIDVRDIVRTKLGRHERERDEESSKKAKRVG